MRLSEQDRAAILRAAARVAGPLTRVTLFGSRVDDAQRGGDIDLLVELPTPVDRPAVLAASLEAAIVHAIGEQKIDVLLAAPNLQEQAIHHLARTEGVLL